MERPFDGFEDTTLDGTPPPEHAASPLWMVSQAPTLTALVATLQQAKHDLVERGGGKIALSRAVVERARAEFGEMIRRGERDLHLLATLLAAQLLGPTARRSVVIGEVEGTGERFTLSVDLDEDELFRSTDLDLGTRVLSRLRILDGAEARQAQLVSNVVEYEAQSRNKVGATRLLTRIKAEEEIWNKVVDEIFELDRLVLRDKELRNLGRYVKDVFGLKIVVADKDDVYRAQSELALLAFPDEDLTRYGLPLDDAHRRLAFLEVKDYLKRRSRKQSGWSAMKSVVTWAGRTFEIQVQPLSNFLHERELLTRESHAGFKSTREQVRDEVARRLPLFGFYRALLRWLFLTPHAAPPQHPGVEVVVDETPSGRGGRDAPEGG